MLVNQNHCCAICNRHESLFSRKLFVDHCHTTGKVRGLLCYGCNTGIGLFNEDSFALNKAIEYLKVNND